MGGRRRRYPPESVGRKADRSVGWEDQGDGGTFAQFAVERYSSAVKLDQAADQRQTKAGTLLNARPRVGDLAEWFKHDGDILGSNADARVLYGDPDSPARRQIGRDRYAAFWRGKLDRVRDDIEKGLFDAQLVSAQLQPRRLELDC